jgi:oxygen-dependent protoporphyrinogen oxidase
MKRSKDSRICIVGAGPAGLTAAEILRDLGYTHVTLLEKRDRVGGQSLSQTFQTPSSEQIIYELGSVMPFGSGEAQRLIKKYGLHYGRTITLNGPAYFKRYDVDSNEFELDFTRYRLLGKKISLKLFFQMMSDTWKLAKSLWRYRCLSFPGFHQLPMEYAKELNMPYQEWVDRQQFKVIGEDLKLSLGSMLSFANVCYDDIPTTKLLQFIYQLLKHPIRYINGTYVPIREGYQELWNRVAATHDVRLNTTIQSIARKNGVITVTVDDKPTEYDYLILTCTPSSIFPHMDVTTEEQSLFSKVKYCPGWRAAFTAQNMPFDAAYNITASCFYKNKSGISLFIPEGRVDDKTWLYTCTLSQNQTDDLNALQKMSEEFLQAKYGAANIQWVMSAHWDEYGSYFTAKDIANGIYKQLDQLQGKNNTFYLGEIVSGSSHCIVSTYAAYFIKREFA